VPWFLHLLLTFLMVGMPTGGRFGSVPLDEEHEREQVELKTSKQVAGEHQEQRPIRIRAAREQIAQSAATHVGFVSIQNPRAVEHSLRGAAERRML
jgi:hypothetical protein